MKPFLGHGSGGDVLLERQGEKADAVQAVTVNHGLEIAPQGLGFSRNGGAHAQQFLGQWRGDFHLLLCRCK